MNVISGHLSIAGQSVLVLLPFRQVRLNPRSSLRCRNLNRRRRRWRRCCRVRKTAAAAADCKQSENGVEKSAGVALFTVRFRDTVGTDIVIKSSVNADTSMFAGSTTMHVNVSYKLNSRLPYFCHSPLTFSASELHPFVL